mgnify:CR=1 FL=1
MQLDDHILENSDEALETKNSQKSEEDDEIKKIEKDNNDRKTSIFDE